MVSNLERVFVKEAGSGNRKTQSLGTASAPAAARFWIFLDTLITLKIFERSNPFICLGSFSKGNPHDLRNSCLSCAALVT